MKIVGVSIFNEETVSDILIAENVPDYFSKRIVNLLNEYEVFEHSKYFFHEKPDDYILYKFEY